MKQEMNNIAQCTLHISYNFAQCQSRDFPTELCCNTIIHLLFHCIDPYFIFKFEKKILVLLQCVICFEGL